MDTQTLANKIAIEIMTIGGSGERADRLALMKNTSRGTERGLGGRNKYSVATCVKEELDHWLEQLKGI